MLCVLVRVSVCQVVCVCVCPAVSCVLVLLLFNFLGVGKSSLLLRFADNLFSGMNIYDNSKK